MPVSFAIRVPIPGGEVWEHVTRNINATIHTPLARIKVGSVCCRALRLARSRRARPLQAALSVPIFPAVYWLRRRTDVNGQALAGRRGRVADNDTALAWGYVDGQTVELRADICESVDLTVIDRAEHQRACHGYEAKLRLMAVVGQQDMNRIMQQHRQIATLLPAVEAADARLANDMHAEEKREKQRADRVARCSRAVVRLAPYNRAGRTE
jgi:hypothetical protein